MGFGIDLGSTSLKVVSVQRGFGGYRVTGAARKRATRAGGLPKLLHEALGARNGARAGVVGLSGRDINLQLVQQPNMKPLNYRVMMGYELDQRRGEATDLYLDYCTLREPDAFFPNYLAVVGIGKSTYVDERINLLKQAALDVRDAVPNSFALFAAYRNAYDPEGGTILLLDVGSDNMDLAFVRGGRLIFARNVSSGARVFDNQIAGALGLSPEEAEAHKVARGTLGPAAEGEEDDELRPAVRSAAGQLVGFITSSINHAKMQLNDRELAIDRVYLSGGGARVRGLPEYLSGALKIPVEPLDPFRKLDTAAVERQPGGEQFRELPTDMAVAIGLAQLVSPTPAVASSTLSILPDALKKRRNFFRSTLWLTAGGAVLLLSLLVLTGLAFARRSAAESSLEKFRADTLAIKEQIDRMDRLSTEARDLASKSDYLLSYLSGGRAALDVVARLGKALPKGMTVREVKMGDFALARRGGSEERTRVALNVRGRGLVVGEIESESGDEIRIKGQSEPIPNASVQGEILRWPAIGRAIVVTGEVDENIRGGQAGEAVKALRDQLTDTSRGMKARVGNQKASTKPGWREFEIVVTFE
jgi:type IV pilus assembly protein PilM